METWAVIQWIRAKCLVCIEVYEITAGSTYTRTRCDLSTR